MIGSCKELSSGNETDMGAAYLAWVAMENLSDLFHNADTALLNIDVDTLAGIGQLAMNYTHIDADVTPPHIPPIGLASGVMGIISGITGAAGLGFLSGATGTVAGITSAVNTASLKGSDAMPDSQYATSTADAQKYLGTYIENLRDTMASAYNDIFTIGTNMTTLLQGGAFVNRSSMQIDCASCAQTAQGWMEQYMALKMINSIWTQQNVFIMLLPYGQITQVDSNGQTGVKTNFDESACENFPAGALPKVCFAQDGSDFNWPPGLNPGMAVLTFYDAHAPGNKPGDKNGPGYIDLSNPPAGVGFDGSMNDTTTAQYKFNVSDVIHSSVGGFANTGFGWDSTEDKVLDAITNSGNGPIGDIFNITAATPGVFNIPVCVTRDLNRFPTYWGQKGRTGSYSLCQCFGSTDRTGKKFSDVVIDELAYISSHAIEVDTNQTCT